MTRLSRFFLAVWRVWIGGASTSGSISREDLIFVRVGVDIKNRRSQQVDDMCEVNDGKCNGKFKLALAKKGEN
jgi:hypothetical protein